MKQLMMDTSTPLLFVLIAEDGHVVDYTFELVLKDHSSKLLPKIEALFKKNNWTIQQIDAFYVTDGPGSYTGLRIGISVAKMFSYTLNKPLYSISTLQIISLSYLHDSHYLVPLIDARRGNVFATIYEVKEGSLFPIIPIGLYAFSELLDLITQRSLQDVQFVGLDAIKFKQDSLSVKSDFIQDFNPQELMNLPFQKVENIHTFVPNYRRLTEAEMNQSCSQ